MEKKNMVLLTVIAVATLLVAVVGATFAYFTASATPQGDGAGTKVDITTNKLDGANVKFEAGSQLEMLNYPGGLAVYEGKATIEKQETDSDKNEYEATFNLKIDYTNETGTDLDWTLYMVASEYTGLDAAKTTTCELKQKQQNGQVLLWYSDKTEGLEELDPTTDKGCKGEAITNAIQALSATTIAHGKLKSGQTSTTINKDSSSPEFETGDQDLENRKINTSDTTTKYYYLVVKYPNENENQSTADAGQKISVKLSIDGDIHLSLYEGE